METESEPTAVTTEKVQVRPAKHRKREASSARASDTKKKKTTTKKKNNNKKPEKKRWKKPTLGLPFVTRAGCAIVRLMCRNGAVLLVAAWRKSLATSVSRSQSHPGRSDRVKKCKGN